jgi:hypothetical protein
VKLVALTCHGFDPLSVLESAFPFADFSAYLRFIEACREKKPEGSTHDHHICPQACFPERVEEPENLIALSVEDHARAHALLNDVGEPDLYTPTGFIAMSSTLSSEHQAKAGRAGGRSKSPAKMQALAALRKKLTPEMRSRNGRHMTLVTNHRRWHVKRCIVNPLCELCRAKRSAQAEA